MGALYDREHTLDHLFHQVCKAEDALLDAEKLAMEMVGAEDEDDYKLAVEEAERALWEAQDALWHAEEDDWDE